MELNFLLPIMKPYKWKQELVEPGDAPQKGLGLREVVCLLSVYQIKHKDIMWSVKSVIFVLSVAVT